MSALVTEAHRAITESVCELLDSEEMIGPSPVERAAARRRQLVERAAQLIADSEAAAKQSLLAAYDAVVVQRNRVTTERDQLRAECLNLRADLDAIKAIRDEEKARADEAEHDCRDLIGQLNDALAELDGIRALAGRNKQYCFKDTARELVAALDQALDIAQAELKAEQDIRVINEIELKVSRAIVSKIWTQLGSPTYEQLKGRSIYHLIDELKAELARERARMDYILRVCSAGVFYNATSRAAIDAAMKEGN